MESVTQMSNLMKIRPMGDSRSMRRDAQMDRRDEANSHFS